MAFSHMPGAGDPMRQDSDEWDNAGESIQTDVWDEWDELGILPPSEQPDEWPEDRLRRARRFRKGRRHSALRTLLPASALVLVAAIILTASLAHWIPAWGNGHASTPPASQTATPAAPQTITLFAPDANNQTRQDTTGPLATSLPNGTQPAPTDYLPPDRPSAYELSLIAAIGTPGKVIVVSKYSQTIHVYQNGAFIAGSYAITGRPSLPTPSGVWHIFYKLAPATLYSPWPPGSPYWYPPTPVSYTMEFKDGGFLIHDAPWHHVWGPGMNGWHYDPVAKEWQWGSHGCVNAPTPFVKWLYAWSPLGTTVIVY